MTPEPDPVGWIPNSEEIEVVREQLKNAIALDAKTTLGISFDPDYLTGEYPEVTPQILTYYGPQAVSLSRQNLDWLEPAFLDVLASHGLGWVWGPDLEKIKLACGGDGCTREFADEQEWREHVWAELKGRCNRAAGR